GEALLDRVRAAKVVSGARHEGAVSRGRTPRRVDGRPRGRVAVDGPAEHARRPRTRRAGDESVPEIVHVDQRCWGTEACSFELAERQVERRLRLRLGTALLVE